MTQYDPRQQRPVTPPQWQQGGQPQYPRHERLAPVFPPGYQGQPNQQGYYPPPQYQQPQQPQPPRKRKGLAFFGCGGLGALVVLIAILASHSSPSSSAPAAGLQPTQAAQSSAPAAAQTVTYVVTGSGADVTYGPTGTSISGAVPMHVTKPLGTPQYYSIDAQLQGGGTVSCKIEVDGKVISQSTASGSYNIASCEISQDPFSGAWSDTNG
jgi:hypothetical protein